MRFINKILPLLLVLVGSITWSITMVKSGFIYPFGMGFWGPNGHDGVWHVALINSLARGSFEMPIYSGEQIRNYHIGFDLILAGIHKATSIPAHILYFQIVPPVLAVLIGLLTYKFVLLWRGSKIQAFWATFFVYFAGDFGWLVTLARGDGFGGESLFWAQQAVSSLVNPPFALSLVFLLLGAILLLCTLTKKKFNIYCLIFAILLFGVLSQIKVYAWILVMGSLVILILIQVLRAKGMPLNLITTLLVFFGSLVFGMTLLFVTNKPGGQLIVFQPLWFLETMMAVSDRVGWDRFYEALINYKTGYVWLKLIPAYIIAFFIFFVGNMGTRIIGVWDILKDRTWRKFSEIDIFLLATAVLGTILPMLILQSGTPWNTIQFFYYSLFVFAIYSGAWLGGLIEKMGTESISHISIYDARAWLIILLTIPTTTSTLLNNYLPGRPPAKISTEELRALRFLEKQQDGVVLTYPFDRLKAEAAVSNPPRPLYLYESTAYVSAFSKKPVFLEDEVNLDITGFNWKERREESKIPFESLSGAEVHDFLETNKIKYLYLVLSQTLVFGQRFRLGEAQLGLTNIFENKEVVIYQVN